MWPFSRRRASPSRKSTGFDLVSWRDALAGNATESGVAVTSSTALEVGAVLACVRRVADDVAKLPLEVFALRGNQEVALPASDQMRSLLASRPNDRQTSWEWRWMMTARAMLWGEALAVRETVAGRTSALWPVQPGAWSVTEARDLSLIYRVTSPDGTLRELGQREVLHLRRMPFGAADASIATWRVARESIGLARAAEGGQAKVFGNGSRPSGVLTTDNDLTDEQLTNLRDKWRTATSRGAMFGVPVLDRGLKFQAMSLSAVDAQAVETRKHQVIEICAALGVLPAVLGVDDKTQAFASVEAMMRAHLSHTIEPWLCMWEMALDRDVLDGPGQLAARFSRTRMERASELDQATADRSRIESGLRTANELRARDGLAPLPGGDDLRIGLNIGRAADASSGKA